MTISELKTIIDHISFASQKDTLELSLEVTEELGVILSVRLLTSFGHFIHNRQFISCGDLFVMSENKAVRTIRNSIKSVYMSFVDHYLEYKGESTVRRL